MTRISPLVMEERLRKKLSKSVDNMKERVMIEMSHKPFWEVKSLIVYLSIKRNKNKEIISYFPSWHREVKRL